MSARAPGVARRLLPWVLGAVAVGCSGEGETPAPEAPVDEVRAARGTEGAVLDCRDGVQACRWVTLEAVPRCEGWSGEACTRDTDVAAIRYVPVHNNYVDAPFTRERFRVSALGDVRWFPWDAEPLPDGSWLVTDKRGQLMQLVDGELRVVHVVDAVSLSEAGLLGLAVDPGFAENGFVYVFYTSRLDDAAPPPPADKPYGHGVLGVVERLTLRDGAVTARRTILDRVPGSLEHCGGRLDFGPDGMLYLTTGDGNRGSPAVDPDSWLGKVLRFAPDGSIPADNPFPGSPVWSLGHRNPQGLAWHPETGDLWVSEHGPWRFDEIHRVHPGVDHGWDAWRCSEPNGAGARSVPAPVPPVVCFEEWTMAPSGMAFVPDPEHPWYGSLFVAGLRGGHLHRYAFDGDAVVTDEIFFVSGSLPDGSDAAAGAVDLRLRDVRYHEGALYVLGDVFGFVKLEPLP